VTHFIKGPMVLFDLETDGKDPDDAHLIESALIHVNRPDHRRWEQVWVAQPTRPIPDEAAGVHGFTTERAMAEGRPRDEVLTEIIAALAPWGPHCPLVAHNACYDLTVLDRNLHRELGIDLEIRGPVIDTLLLDKCCDQWRPGSRQLADTVRHYRLNLVNAHSAAADALAAGQVAWRLATMKNWPYGRYGPNALEREARLMMAAGDAPSLHRAQQRWYESRQRELAEYFRTSKAVESIERKVRERRMTREQADAAILDLPAAADRAEATAQGWPLRPRVPVVT
jgi:DNA polymerase III epsilon subunit-like protein